MAGIGMVDFRQIPQIDASCALCGAPAIPECPHEGEQLKKALNQAEERWCGVQGIRDWVLNHAKLQIIDTFHHLRDLRTQQMQDALEMLPYYTLYVTYHGNPPIPPHHLRALHQGIARMQRQLQLEVDEDWKRCCQRYPEVLDYFFSLVQIQLPSERDPVMTEPRFGAPVEKPRKLKAGHDAAVDLPSRKKERRRSRGRTPPIVVVPGSYPRR